METVGLGLYYEDLPIGRTFRTIGRTITETDLVNFIGCTGLVEVIFTDAEYREKESEIKGRVVPGVLVYSLIEGLLVQATMQRTGLALLRVEFDIHAPVFVGDTVHGEIEVIEARLSRSRPNCGLIRSRNRVVNQAGTLVQTYNVLRMVRARGEGGK
jgi:acyl dehydratase